MAEAQPNGHDKKSATAPFKKGYKRSAESIAKQKATIAERKKARAKLPRKARKKHDQNDDAIVYLRLGEKSINARLASGELAKEDMAHLLLKLALKTLQGEK